MTEVARGLTSQEVKERLQKFGFNEIEEKKISAAFENFLKILSDPMGTMLLILSFIYWFLGKQSDAVILLVAYIPITAIDVLLELRSQKALRSLKRTLQSSCHVIRNGRTQKIPIRELVPMDLLLLEEGQAIPADGKLIEAVHLTIDEASVTGESIPVEKAIGNEVLSGTTILTGKGLIEVERTGLSSQVGSIAKVLREFEATTSPLLRTIRRVVKIIFFGAFVLAILVFILELLKAHGIGPSLISALTLAMAAIPEEFPLVFTLYLSLAAFRLSKKGILVKSLPAVEALGRVNVICTDKTGTLTEGKFRLEKLLVTQDGARNLDLETQALVFSCEPNAVDAMESSMLEWVTENQGFATIETLRQQWVLEFDYPFDNREKYMSHVWRKQGSGQQFIAMKGALEGVLSHCEPSTAHADILKLAQNEAESGRRLLGLAARVGSFVGDRERDEKSLQFIGILSFTDPVRPGVKEATRLCGEHGIKIKMLTGDHLLTAHAIADRIDLPHRHDELYNGPDLEAMSSEARKAAYKQGTLFARLKPEQKLELVEALKSEGNIVAMTGDGINDAPALKLADVGISMGETATDVARSTAQLVLMKNDFRGIVAAVLEGQRVLNSLSQSFGYLIAFHIPIIGVALYQAFFLEASILLPIHIVLMELIVHPVSALVFDEKPMDLTSQRKELINKKIILWSTARGVLLTIFSVSAFFLSEGSLEERRSLSVLLLVLGNIGLLLGEKGGFVSAFFTGQPLRPFIAASLLLCLSFALVFVPMISDLFLLINPTPIQFTGIILIGILIGAIHPSKEVVQLRRQRPELGVFG